MFLGWPLQTRPAIDTVSSHLGNCRAPRAASYILRWKDRRYMFVPQDQWSLGRKSTLHRCDFWISVGEQIQNLSRGTSTDFNKSSDHWSIRLLWHRQSGYCNTRRIVQSCLTLSKWRKIDFSVMPVPVWNNNKQNWCSTADGTVLTPIKNASSAVRGVHLKWVQPCKKGTELWKFMKSGIFPKTSVWKDCLPGMWIHG